MKTLLRIVTALLFSLCIGAAFGMAVGINPLLVSGGLFAVSMIPKPSMAGCALDGVYLEVWTKKVKEELSGKDNASFLEGIEDFSNYVSNVGDEAQAIHITDFQVMPEVLINNTTYPIPVETLDQDDIVIALDKYTTKPTAITDDELYALSFDKTAKVRGKHTRAIDRKKHDKAIHSLAPTHSTATPVLLTTGANDGTGRKMLVRADIISLKRAWDNAGVPEVGRRLVLCNDHVNDLLLDDQSFKDQYHNYETGKIANLYGFEIYEFGACPYYVPATKAKLSFGAVPSGTDRKASVAFCLERAAKASGWVKMYYSEAKNNPETQRSLINFRHNFIVMPTHEDSRGAIVSANV